MVIIAVDGVDLAAGFLIRLHDGWALSAAAAVSLAVFLLLLRYAVAPYCSHLGASLSGLQSAFAGGDDAAAVESCCRASGGLDGATIARLPCFVAARRSRSQTTSGANDATTDHCCTVCLGAVEEGETVRALPFCRHAFHARCVDAWLRLRPTCPVCRATFS
ncbi:RING-H2 finger protein ATL39 [Brachypodium distachyon]|uniref:RING-type E3 ubiquitin transferase n=1 Tax=Brachypodium distachyon TaxID=15368 RepID=A0A0Q3MFS0_BRADI|nr:RING-H2 finger protein ATL39 [Brachypodium distachyon]KQK03286.1 hypothetical protein BRADI_2g06845v3 [Brachypodium distachyon]|eukprot:XP_014754394.1 RING-H2 finger protein ATL39 [Brachypodium distachyon]